MSDNTVQIAKHTITGSFWLYSNDQELQDIEIYPLNVEKYDTNLLCTPPSAKFVCSPALVNKHRKINLFYTSQSWETQLALIEVCKEYKDISLLHQGDIGHTKLLNMEIDMGDHPDITQKPYTLPLKHS